MEDLNPLSPDFVEGPLRQPPSPLLKSVIDALGVNYHDPTSGLRYLQSRLAERQSRSDASASLMGFQDDAVPAAITDRRGVVGSLLQNAGVLGEPSPRPLTDREKAAAIYGMGIRAKMNVARALMEHRQYQDWLSTVKAQSEIGDREHRSKREDIRLGGYFGNLYGGATGNSVLHAVGGPEFLDPNAMGQTGARAAAVEHQGVMEGQGQQRIDQGQRGLDLRAQAQAETRHNNRFNRLLGRRKFWTGQKATSSKERQQDLKEIKDLIAIRSGQLNELDKQTVIAGIGTDEDAVANAEEQRNQYRSELDILTQLYGEASGKPMKSIQRSVGSKDGRDANDLNEFLMGGGRLMPPPAR